MTPASEGFDNKRGIPRVRSWGYCWPQPIGAQFLRTALHVHAVPVTMRRTPQPGDSAFEIIVRGGHSPHSIAGKHLEEVIERTSRTTTRGRSCQKSRFRERADLASREPTRLK